MGTIYHEMLVYAIDSGDQYPTVDKWCDLLLKHPTRSFVTPASFRCPAHETDRCNYALNPDCEPNSPGDVVLLFETEGGWNQSGGPESLTFDNHKRKGANVLFNDGRVEFIKPNELDKLRWSAD